MARKVRILGLHADDANWATLSYARSLPRAVGRHAGFAMTTVNIARLSKWDRLSLLAHLRFGRYDAIFLFHSVFSNANYVSPPLESSIRRARIPVAFFVGNEFKLMPEKMEFADRLGVALLVSQIARPQVHELYRRRLACEVLFLPNATFDAAPFAEAKPASERRIDIGYRAFEGAWYLGHDDRGRVATIVAEPAAKLGLRLDISLDPSRRLAALEWQRFLGDCRGQLGTEAGTNAFELDDATRIAVNAFCEANPEATFDEVLTRYFPPDGSRVSGRTISSRHIEAAAARCVQLLLPGDYAGIFRPDEHYIELARDGSNVDEALAKFADPSVCARLSEAAFEAAATQFSESRLMRKLETVVRGIAT
jgi:hypothetical protein